MFAHIDFLRPFQFMFQFFELTVLQLFNLNLLILSTNSVNTTLIDLSKTKHMEDHYRQKLQMQKHQLAQQYQTQAQQNRERKQQQNAPQGGQQHAPTRSFDIQSQNFQNPYLLKKQSEKLESQKMGAQQNNQSNQYLASRASSNMQAQQQVPAGYDQSQQLNQSIQSSGQARMKGQIMNNSYFSQISSINGAAANGNLNQMQSSGHGGGPNMAQGSIGGQVPSRSGMNSANNSQLSMSGLSHGNAMLQNTYQHPHPSQIGKNTGHINGHPGQMEHQNAQKMNESGFTSASNYMAMGGATAERDTPGTASTKAQRSANRQPNNLAVQSSFYGEQSGAHNSASGKIHANSYTPMVERGSNKDQNQRNINAEQNTPSYQGPPGSQKPPSQWQNNASAEIEKDLSDLPQAKSQMMANFEKQQENFFRPPNVYRQTLNVDNLITVCSKKLSEDPNHKKALFIRASSYLKKGQFQQSIDDCNHLMQLDEMHAGAYYVRGCAYEKLDMIDKSIEDFTQVLQIDPHHINAAYARGACENKRGNFAKAIDDYNMALAIDKERAMSPNLNRRMPFRVFQLNQSNVNPNMINGSRMDSNSNSILSYSSKAGPIRNNMWPGGDDQRDQSPLGGHGNGLNNSGLLGDKNLVIMDPNASQLAGPPQTKSKVANNTALMSPSVNASSRAGFMNDTRISMQSSHLKSSECVRIHNMNQSIGGASVLSASRNNNVTQVIGVNPVTGGHIHNSNGGPSDMRPISINSSIDLKNTTQYSLQNISLQGTGLLANQLQYESNQQSAIRQHQADMNSQAQRDKVNQWNSQEEYNQYILKKKQADEFHAKGYEARKKSDYKTAIKFYTMALEIMPNHFKALFNRGFACDKIGQFDNAIADYSKAIEIDPVNAYTYYNKGISLDRKGDYDEAIKCFSKAISIEPSKADFYHNRGFAFRKKREFDNAIKDYENAIRIDPNHFKAYYNRAFCWDKLGKYDQSEADYKSSVDLQPKNISALHHLGTIREKIGGEKLDLALENFNEVIKIDNSYAPSYNGRGLVWDRFFKFEEAINDFTMAIEIDRKNPVYLHNRGCCYRNMGDLENSILDFDEAIKLDDKNPIIYSNRGLVNRKLERFELAIQDYSNEIKFGVMDVSGRSNNIKAFNNRAYCLAKLGRYKEAIVDYTTVIQQDKTNIHALHNRGISFERLARYKEAVKDFSRVIEIDPQNANAYFNRGCCYDSIGELDLAISDYSVALELDLRSGNEDVDEQIDEEDEENEQDNDEPKRTREPTSQNAQLPPRPTPQRQDQRRQMEPAPAQQQQNDEDDFNVNETDREGYSPNRKNINKDVSLQFNQRRDSRGRDDVPHNTAVENFSRKQEYPSQAATTEKEYLQMNSQQDDINDQKQQLSAAQNPSSLFRSKFLTQTSNIQNPREQVAFERVNLSSADPTTLQDSYAGSAYSSVISTQQQPAPPGSTMPQQVPASHPMQMDPQKRQGVNEYLQKKYSQKFNLH